MKKDALRIGLIGAGGSRVMYGPVLRHLPAMSLVAVADTSPDARQKARDELGVAKVYETAEAMCAGERLDAVLVASPPYCHLEHVQGAAHAGAHVMVEKPMARTTAEAEGMIAACRSAGTLLAVGFNRRFMPPMWTATQMVKSGELGHVFHVECIFTSWTAPGDGGWRDTARCLGGGFQDHGSHTFDLARQWLGSAKTVYAHARRIGPLLGSPREVEDHMSAMITHEGGGTSIHVHSRDSHRPISEHYRIYGTKGTLEFAYVGTWAAYVSDNWEMSLFREGNPVPRRLVSRRPDNELLQELGDGPYSYYRELSLFADAARSGSVGQTPTGEEGLAIVRAISAAYFSAAEGRSVDVRDGDLFDEKVYARLVEGCAVEGRAPAP